MAPGCRYKRAAGLVVAQSFSSVLTVFPVLSAVAVLVVVLVFVPMFVLLSVRALCGAVAALCVAIVIIFARSAMTTAALRAQP